MEKFWQIKNEVDTELAEILFYGAISDESWWGDEVTPRQFASDLAALNGKDVTVRINSPGGDVFAAHAIHNQLINYSGNVTVKIDGLAASAATIVAMAGKVIMPTNSMLMIHNPSLGLCGHYNANDLDKMAKDLEVIKSSIIAAYLKKCNNIDEKKLSKLMSDETWMGATQALELGFADEIEGSSVDMVLNEKYLVVNSVQFDWKNIKNRENFSNIIKNNNKEGENVGEKAILDKIKKLLGLGEIPKNTEKNNVQDAVNQERERLAALDALLDDNPAVREIVNQAKKEGKTADEVKIYVEAIKKYAPAQDGANKALEQIKNLIQDNKESGAEGVSGITEQTSLDEQQQDKQIMDYMINCMNQKMGGKNDGRIK